MKVLTVYAHNNPRSSCHGVLDHFTQGLRDAGHASEVIDLYAIKFDPVFRDRDVATSATPDLVERYFQQAYQLGRDFERPATGAGQATPAA